MNTRHTTRFTHQSHSHRPPGNTAPRRADGPGESRDSTREPTARDKPGQYTKPNRKPKGRTLTTFLADLSQRDMQRRLSEALRVYVIAMGYPHGTEDQRAPMWLEHSRRHGWQAAAIFDAPAIPSGHDAPPVLDPEQARMVGIAYGYRGAADQWWHQQVSQGLRKSGRPRDQVNTLLEQYFELTELHVDPQLQGHGYGEALARRLLSRRTESHVLLSTPEITGESNRAWRLYRRLGFTDVIRQHQFAGDPRRFAVLGRPLPLEPGYRQPDISAVWHDNPR